MSKQLEHDLAAVIATHAGWLDGRTWQAAAQRVAEAYFEAEDLSPIINADALGSALSHALDAKPEGV